MIKRLKNIVRRNFHNQKQNYQAIASAHAFAKLNTLFNEDQFIPYTSWAMSPRTILHILNIVEIKRPQAIIEFGSGVTTIYLAKILKSSEITCKFYSVESDNEWKLTIEKKLKQLGLEDQVKIILAPLTKVKDELSFQDQKSWYDDESIRSQIQTNSKFEMVIVDGPYGGSSPFARFSAFPFLKDQSSENTVWFLDDTNRKEEKIIINEWQEQSNLNLRNFSRYSTLSKGSIFNYEPFTI